LEELNILTDDEAFEAGIFAMDMLMADSAAAIDEGNYGAALEGFRSTLALARHLFGQQAELSELEKTIADINELIPDA
jgi:hypothetical protein